MDEWFQGKLMKDRKLKDFRRCRCCGRRADEVNLDENDVCNDCVERVYWRGS